MDANLLIGYVIGSLNTQHLQNCRATKSFSADDFTLLNGVLKQFCLIVTTPHVLTEVSNLAGKLRDDLHIPVRTVFQNIIGRLAEQSEPAKAISVNENFLRFGLADTARSMIAPRGYLVLTDDLALFGLLKKRGIDAVNFNHLRSISW